MSLKTIILSIILLILGASSIYFSVKITSLTGMVESIRKEQMTGSSNISLAPLATATANTQIETQAVQKQYILFGQIISFSGNTMIIKTTILNPNGPVGQGGQTVTVSINDQTKFLKRAKKDPTIYQKEMEDFQNTPVEKRGVMPPLPFNTDTINRDAFIAGKIVSVQSVEEITPETVTVFAQAVGLSPDMPFVPAK